jgi:uncharacterized oxidoreductase
MNTSGNTVFIPGATSGIGLGLALKLQEAGNTVIIGGRRTDRLERIVAEHPGIHAVTIDVADAASIADVSARVKAEHPDVNVLITMAGIMEFEDLRSADHLAIAETAVTTNLLGTIRLIAAFTEHFLTKEDATIVTVSSGLAFVPLPSTPTYSATKAAVHSFTDSLRVQLEGTSVRVVELAPPGVQTEILGGAMNATNMPLQDFLDEAFALLATDADQILVENVQPLRFAEANGNYDEVLAMLSGA